MLRNLPLFLLFAMYLKQANAIYTSHSFYSSLMWACVEGNILNSPCKLNTDWSECETGVDVKNQSMEAKIITTAIKWISKPRKEQYHAYFQWNKSIEIVIILYDKQITKTNRRDRTMFKNKMIRWHCVRQVIINGSIHTKYESVNGSKVERKYAFVNWQLTNLKLMEHNCNARCVIAKHTRLWTKKDSLVHELVDYQTADLTWPQLAKIIELQCLHVNQSLWTNQT